MNLYWHLYNLKSTFTLYYFILLCKPPPPKSSPANKQTREGDLSITPHPSKPSPSRAILCKSCSAASWLRGTDLGLTVQRRRRQREEEEEEGERGGCCIVAPAATAPSQYICARPLLRSCLERDAPPSQCRCGGVTARTHRDTRDGTNRDGTLSRCGSIYFLSTFRKKVKVC